MLRKTMVVVGLCVGVLGCATYQQPTEGPIATLNFERLNGANIPGAGQFVSYFVPEDENCETAARVAFFGTGAPGGDDRDVRFVGGQPIRLMSFIELNSVGYEDGQLGRTDQIRCYAEASFTPLEGRSYDVSVDYQSRTSCGLNIVDLATGASPSDLQTGSDVCPSKTNRIPDNSVPSER